jgi:RimJ/RimL family protein N-acetyltransferase
LKSEYQQFFPDSFTLETPRVLLRLVTPEDYGSFLALAKEKEIWAYFSKDLSDESELQKWMNKLFRERAQEIRMPFTVIDKHTHEICGSASFVGISFYNKCIEIGSVWLGKPFVGTGIMREAGFALLSYAFEVMRMERVEVRVDNLNERAKSAFLKIGMIPEGVLRSNTIVHGNRRRDTLYFSMLRGEWQERKEHFFPEMI